MAGSPDLLSRRSFLIAASAEKAGAGARFDFTRETDASRSLTIATGGDDDQHSQMFQLVCRFLQVHWPTETQRPS